MKFSTILADPPWGYDRTSKSEKLTGYCDKQYSVLSAKEIEELPVANIAADDAVLLLWTTWPFLPTALRTVDSWGFRFVTGLTWVKTLADVEKLAYGVGYWFRGSTEPLLVGKRGAAHRTNLLGLIDDRDGFVSPRLLHSRKPSSIYEVTKHFPGPQLELFARKPQPGWYALGNECPGDGWDIRERLSDLELHGTWEDHLQ